MKEGGSSMYLVDNFPTGVMTELTKTFLLLQQSDTLMSVTHPDLLVIRIKC